MKCLFCENPVPLIQSLVQRGVPFCSDGHKKAFHMDMQRLMLARLMDTLKRYPPARIDEAFAGPVQPGFEPVKVSLPERGPEMRLNRLLTS